MKYIIDNKITYMVHGSHASSGDLLAHAAGGGSQGRTPPDTGTKHRATTPTIP